MYILFGYFHFCSYTEHPKTPDWPNLKNAWYSTSHLLSLEASRSLFYEQIKYSIVTLEEKSPLLDAKVMTASVTIEYFICL